MIEFALFCLGVAMGAGAATWLARRDWRGRAPCPHEYCRNRLPAPGLKRGGAYVGETCSACDGAVRWNPRWSQYERITAEEVVQ